MPKNAQGQSANKSNEAHMLGVYSQAYPIFIAEYNAQADQVERDVIMAKWKYISDAQEEAQAKAIIGDAYWRITIEAGNNTILDYWVDGTVVYPQIINYANVTSKLSFLSYLAHSLIEDGHPILSEDYTSLLDEQLRVKQEAGASTYWKFKSISELVN